MSLAEEKEGFIFFTEGATSWYRPATPRVRHSRGPLCSPLIPFKILYRL